MGKRWRIRPHDTDRIVQLERSVGVGPVVASLLLCRGITDPLRARQFLDAKLSDLRDPEDLPGVTAAADCIYQAVIEKRRVVVYGDYDADGMTATAILLRCLQFLGADAGYYLPNRMDEGYGLNVDAMEKLAARGTELVVSVDCGIASVEPARAAREAGMQLVITDHHEPGPQLPDATVLVHPRLPGHAYPFGQLCGAGIAFKLAWALCQRADQAKKVGLRLRNFLIDAMALVAIGTVADVVPLIDENRVLVRHGLKSLTERATPGLAALMKAAGVHGRSTLTSEDIGFAVAPRLNAAGRLGQAQLAVELLASDSHDRSASLAEYLNELNKNRQTLERSIQLAAGKQAKNDFDPVGDPALVLAGRGWHPGVIGIVAGRLAEKFNRPVVLLALDPLAGKPAAGSARTAGGLNLHRALAACGEHLITHGGHAAAAGLKIDESSIDAFRADFCEHVAEELADGDPTPELMIDAEAPLSQLTLSTVEQIEQLAPFGAGNPRPVMCAGDVALVGEPKRIGGGERHLTVRLSQHGVAMRAVAFGQGDWADQLVKVGGPIQIACRPLINQFRGRRDVE